MKKYVISFRQTVKLYLTKAVYYVILFIMTRRTFNTKLLYLIIIIINEFTRFDSEKNSNDILIVVYKT